MAIRYRKSGGTVGEPRLWLVCLVVVGVVSAPLVAVAVADRDTGGGAEDAGDAAAGEQARPAGAQADDGGRDPASTAGLEAGDADPQATMGVTNAEGGPGGTVTVALPVDGEDVAGYQANLSWDPSVLRFESADGVDFADPVTNVNGDAGWVAMTQSRAAGTSSPTVAEVTFTVVGRVGDSSEVTLSPAATSVNDESAQLTTAVENGSVAVVDPPDDRTGDGGEGTADTTPPVADAGPDRVANASEPVRFDATNSTDDRGVANVTWRFGDGTTATGATPTHAFDEPGTYEATATVTDAAGNSDTDTATVTVRAVNVVSTSGSLAEGLTVDVDRAQVGATVAVPVDDDGAVSVPELAIDVAREGSFELSLRSHTGDELDIGPGYRALGGLSVGGDVGHVASVDAELRVAAAGTAVDGDDVTLLHRSDGSWEPMDGSVSATGEHARADLSMAGRGTAALAVAERSAPATTTAPDQARPAEPTPTTAGGGADAGRDLPTGALLGGVALVVVGLAAAAALVRN